MAASLTFAVAAAPAASAADAFSGFYLSGGIGQKSTTMEEGISVTGGSGSVKIGDTSFFGQFGGGYSFAPSQDFRIGLGAFVDAGDGKAGDLSLSAGGTTVSGSLKETRHYGMSIEPGFVIGKDTVAYGKLMYNWATGESGNNVGLTTTSQKFSGFGYGLGLKRMVNSNVYLYAEWQQTDYDTKTITNGTATTTLKPKQTLGLFGIGMTF